MTSDTLYGRAKEVFLRVCDAPGDGRAALVESLCGDDAALRAEVEGLLGHDDDADTMGVGGARAPGSRVGKYTVVRTLGAGSMGVVYEAEIEHPKRSVAIKIGRAGANAASLRRRMEHEVSALARLQHPGIAAVYDTGVDGATGEPYFVMELVHGEPVTVSADRRGLSVGERVGLIAGVCDAVHHAHLRGVIHRDLKPSNILVDQSGRARVLDFGIARLTDDDETVRTMPGQVMGTLGYMSPEQAAGDRDGVDARTDIYALGAVAYELLGGRPALDLAGRPIHEALRRIREDEPARLGAVDRRLRGDLETIIAAAMEKDPARRYQSAESLAADLRRSLRDEPILARAPTTLYQLVKFARRRRGLVAGAGVAAAALVAAAVVSGVFAVRADAERARAERRFAEVRALANTFLFEIHDQVETLPGSLAARQSLVRTGLTYLDSLAAEAGNDPELLGELADAYARIGDLQGNPRRSNLGDPAAALESYAHSGKIRERIERVAPSPENRLAMLRTRVVSGEAVTSGGRAEDAVGHFTAARDGLTALLRERPGDAEVIAALGLAESRLGGVLREMGRLGEALTHFEGALRAAEMDVRHEADGGRAVSVAHNEVGLTLVRMGRWTEARPHYERSMEIRLAEAGRDPHSTRARRDLALVHHRLADVLRKTGDAAGAMGHDRGALALLLALHLADPADARSRFDLSVAHEKLADSLADAGLAGESLAEHGRALGVRGALASDYPDNLLYRKAYSISLERVGNALREQGRHGEARASYLESIAVAGRCNAADDADARVWTSVAAAQRGLGESALAQAGDGPDGGARRREAAEWFGWCLETLGRMDREGMAPVRGGLDTETVTALLARCGSEP